MADIDSLKFEVLLDDKAFRNQIEKDLKSARNLNDQLTALLNLKNAINNKTTEQLVNAEKVKAAAHATAKAAAEEAMAVAKAAKAQADAEAATKRVKSAQEGVTREAQKTENAHKRNKKAVIETKEHLTSTQKVLRVLTQLTGATFSLIGIRRFLASLIEITGQFEVQKMALRTMLQDIDAADKIFQDLYRFSSDSTYRFSELAKYAKQLAAFNIGKDNLLETTKMLGDVASGVGVSMDRLILAYGHVKSSGFLRGIQLRSFSQNGVPILEELSKMMTEIEGKAVSLGDVFDRMTKREIPFEMVEEAFRRMTSEGGKFYKMQEVLSKTLAGQINILKGRWENMLYTIGSKNDGILKNTVAWMNGLIGSYEKIGSAMREVILVFGAYKTAMIITQVATNTFITSNKGLIRSFAAIGKFVAKNPWALLAAAITFVTVEIIKASRELSDFQKIQNAATKGIEEYNVAQKNEIRELDILIGRLKAAREGTDEYKTAKNALENRFGAYIQQLREEGAAVDNLASLYNGLASKIRKANKERFLEATQKDILDNFTSVTDKIEEQTKTVISKLSQSMGRMLTGDEEGSIRHYINTGEHNDIFKSLEAELNKRYTTTRVTTTLHGQIRQRVEDEKTLMEQLRDLFRSRDMAEHEYGESMLRAAKAFDTANDRITGSAKNATQELTGWRKKVDDAISGLGDDVLKKTGLKQKEDEDYFEYLDRVGKKYKELSEERDKSLKKDKKSYDDLLSAIKSVDAALEGNILSDPRYTRTPWLPTDKTDEELKKEIASIKAQISLLDKYKTAYEKLEPVFGERTTSVMKNIPGLSRDYSSVLRDVDNYINRLKALGEEGALAAAQIEAAWGLDYITTMLKAEKQADATAKKVASFRESILALGAEASASADESGFFYKIGKVADDNATKIGKLENTARKLHETLAGFDSNDEKTKNSVLSLLTNKGLSKKDAEDFWEEYVINGSDAIDSLVSRLTTKYNTMAKEKVNSLVTDYIKEQYTLNNIDLTNLSSLSLSQLKSLEERLKTVMGATTLTSSLRNNLDAYFSDVYGYNDGEWMDATVEQLEEFVKEQGDQLSEADKNWLKYAISIRKAEGSIQEFTEKLNSAFKKGLKDLDQKELEALVKFGKYAVDQVKKLAGALGDLAEASGNEGLGETVEAFTAFANVASSAIDGFKQGGPWGAAIGVFTSIATTIIEAQVALEKFNRQLEDTKEEVLTMRFRNALENGVDSLFGENFTRSIRNAVDGINDARKAIEEFSDERKKVAIEQQEWLDSTHGTKYNMSKRRTIREIYGDERVEGYRFKSTKNNYRMSIEEYANKIGMKLYDEYGNISSELVNMVLEKFSETLTADDIEFLKKLRDNSENYALAEKQLAEQIKNIWGSLADSMADSMISAYIEMGDAGADLANNMEDMFDSMAKNIAKSLVSSFIIDNILNGYEDSVKELYDKIKNGETEPEDVAEAFSRLAGDIKKDADAAAAFTNRLLDAMKLNGIMFDSDSAGSVGKGIQSITEDTANLLASYLNAIRADVAGIRAQDAAGWENVSAVREYVPTLDDWLSKIQADTANIAQSNADMLAEIRSVIGQGDDGSAIKVLM